MKRLYLVDVSSMFFRAFYAIRPLSSPSGMPTNAIYGFLSMSIKLMREIKPDYMAFCFDRPEPSFRRDLDQRYKANRAEMPEDLVPQVPYIRKMAEALGIPCFDQKGFEADDIIGSLARWGREHSLEVVIVSGDKDFGQLVRPHLSIYDPMKEVHYDSAGVLEKWGVEPSQMRDYLALVGDSSDNVPGVKGIGPKGAQKLLAEYHSLDGIYQALDQLPPNSTRKKLEEGRDEAYLSQKLVTIVEDLDLGVKPEDLRLKPIVRDHLQTLLAELGFRSFAKTLLGESDASVSGVQSLGQSSGQAPVQNPPPVDSDSKNPFVRKVEPVQAPSDLIQVSAPGVFEVPKLEEKRMSVSELNQWLKPETETWGFHTERGVWIAQGSVIAEVAGDWDELGSLLSSKRLRWKGFDLKEFFKSVHLNPNTDISVVWDQMLAAYVVRPGVIDDVRQLFTLYNGSSLPELPSPAQLAAEHMRLERNLRTRLQSVGGERVLFEIELPLVPVLFAMEKNGILIDQSLLAGLSGQLREEIRVLESEIHREAGEVFNVASPKQLGHILFEKLKMPTGRKTKTGYSTDEDTLAKLAKDHPIVDKILSYRELSKLKSTYVDALPVLINRQSGRVHTTFNQAQTTTGRLSSTNPNLQNIPIRTERGAQIRQAFIASPGHCLISADYSQIELRILASITGDAGLKRAFSAGLDIHTATASEIFDVPVAQVTPEQRRRAKAVNFGLAYGQGAFGLAESLRVSRSEATDIIGRYFNRFQGVKDYMESTVETAKKQGFVETMFGRRRYLDELFSKSPAVRKFGERAAINAPIQGTASDIVKMAMISVANSVVRSESIQMLLQVHDELIFEVPVEKVEALRGEIKRVMEGAVQLSVPLTVNVGAGPNWDQAHS